MLLSPLPSNRHRLLMEYSQLFRTHQSILLVDDDDYVMDSLAYVLKVEGYDVATARNGPAALEFMGHTRPDLVICDFMMPEMNGAQLAMEMRADRRYAEIPVILCTGAHVAQAKRHVELFNVLLTKPVHLPLLLDHVKRLMPSAIAMPVASEAAVSLVEHPVAEASSSDHAANNAPRASGSEPVCDLDS